MANPIPVEHIGNKILRIRGQRVMLDRDVAALYGTKTSVLKAQVTRCKKWLADSVFEVSREEKDAIAAQCDWLKKPLRSSLINPVVFTEGGVVMVSRVINTPKAIEVNTNIIRVFLRLEKALVAHKDGVQSIAKMDKLLPLFAQVVSSALPPLTVLANDASGFEESKRS